MRTIEKTTNLGQQTVIIENHENRTLKGMVDMTVVREDRAFELNSPYGRVIHREFILYASDRSVWGKTPTAPWQRLF